MTIDTKFDKFDINAIAYEYGSQFEIVRHPEESNELYRKRVAGELRKQGHLIEAHEAYSGRRYDDPEQGPTGPLTGILGAAAQADQNLPVYEDQIGVDIVRGVFARQGTKIADSELVAKIRNCLKRYEYSVCTP